MVAGLLGDEAMSAHPLRTIYTRMEVYQAMNGKAAVKPAPRPILNDAGQMAMQPQLGMMLKAMYKTRATDDVAPRAAIVTEVQEPAPAAHVESVATVPGVDTRVIEDASYWDGVPFRRHSSR